MKECCANCGLSVSLTRYYYMGGGCQHDQMPGFVCLAFRDEGMAVWMMGIITENERCECYRPRGGKDASVKG